MAELRFREGTWDRAIWDSVAVRDEYRIGNLVLGSAETVVDVGAHIGSFTYQALDRGAGRVVAVEPDPDNLALLVHNILVACGAGDRCVTVGAAVAVGLDRAGFFLRSADVANTGGGGVTWGETRSSRVSLVNFWELLELASPFPSPIRLVKLDCEGGEWPILENLHLLVDRVEAWVGEYHLGSELAAGRDADWLRERFERQGYAAHVESRGPSLGLFWAWQPGKEIL